MKTFSKAPGGERTREIPCIVCGRQGDPVPYLRCDGFTFVRCGGCSLVYQSSQPVFEDLRNRYDDGYFSYELENERNFFNLMLLGLRDIGFESLGNRLPDRSFLDIGCATGMLISRMKEEGWEVQGVELCEPSARYGIERRGVPIFVGPLEEAGFPDAGFSFVHFSHLIEHLVDPAGFLGEVARILRPGGHAVVVTPNVNGLQARILASRWRSAIADHLFLFSPRTLRILLEGAGLQIRAFRTWGGIAKGLAPGWIKNPVDRLAKLLGFGDVMLYLVEKPVRDEGSTAPGAAS